MTTIRYESMMPVTARDLFEFHMDAANLPTITPPFPPFALLTPAKRSEPGDLQELRLGWQRLGVTWQARVTRVEPDRLVEDVQERGLFRSWLHRHEFQDAAGGAVLRDSVRFRFFPTRAGEFCEYFTIRPLLMGLFRYRHRKTRAALSHHKCS